LTFNLQLDLKKKSLLRNLPEKAWRITATKDNLPRWRAIVIIVVIVLKCVSHDHSGFKRKKKPSRVAGRL
jgi:hypothetical protein